MPSAPSPLLARAAGLGLRLALAPALAWPLAFALPAAPAFAAPAADAAVPPDDAHLRVVERHGTAYVGTLVGRPYGRGVGRFGRYGRFGGYGARTEVVTPVRVTEVYIAKGPFRLSEAQFLDELQRAGVAEGLLREVRAREAEARWHGTLALGSWLGALAAAGIATIELGENAPLISRSPTETVINTAGISALALSIAGAVFTVQWFGDVQPKGAPYFNAFSPAQAQDAIRAYNRKLDGDRPAPASPGRADVTL